MKTKPTQTSVDTFLEGVSEKRREEAHTLIAMMQEISNEEACMWGPSIIGFGTTTYKTEGGTEGNVPILAFSPRKAAITVYFEGFDNYASKLAKLGKHKTSVSCLYINKLTDVDMNILRDMLKQSFTHSTQQVKKG